MIWSMPAPIAPPALSNPEPRKRRQEQLEMRLNRPVQPRENGRSRFAIFILAPGRIGSKNALEQVICIPVN
jgi:hypothetical protein